MMEGAISPRAAWPRIPFANVVIGILVLAGLNLFAARFAFPELPAPLDALQLGSSYRLGIVVPIFFGMRYGAVAGFAVGAVGTLASDLLTYGVIWNWEVGVGLIGFVAAQARLLPQGRRGFLAALLLALIPSVIAVLAGTGFAALTDVWVANLFWENAITAEWAPVALWDVAWAAPLSGLVIGATRAGRR